MSNPSDALKKAIKATSTGTAVELAAQLGISPQALSQWKQVPWNRVLEVERITRIPRHVLRPDIYPPPTRPRRREQARASA